jgi:hypothetical protein
VYLGVESGPEVSADGLHDSHRFSNLPGVRKQPATLHNISVKRQLHNHDSSYDQVLGRAMIVPSVLHIHQRSRWALFRHSFSAKGRKH